MQINARDWTFQATPTLTGTPVYTEIAGIESFTLSNSENEESTDTTTFASQGLSESQVMQRGASLALEGKVVKAAAGVVTDPGQVVVDTLAGLIGEASLGGVRFKYKTDTVWTVWTAWVSKGDTAGGMNDKTSWSATFTRSGAATTVAAP